jgi:hypothetical protein
MRAAHLLEHQRLAGDDDAVLDILLQFNALEKKIK